MPNGARVIKASAEPLIGTRNDQPRLTGSQPWQQEAWAFYNESGPMRYGATWIGNLISRACLRAARITPDGEPEPLTSGPAVDAIDALAGGKAQQSEMLKTMGIHLEVPGVSYLVATQQTDAESWEVLSAETLRQKSPAAPGQSAIYEKRTGNSDRDWVTLPANTLVVKIWQPHPDFWWEPDSPARAALQPLRELRRIGQYIDAVLASRVASNGFFVFPTEANFPTAAGKDGTEGQHPFITEVMQVMMTSIQKPGTASAVVPIPIEIAAEFVDTFQYIDIASQLNDRVLDMRESALRQVAIALDVPAEVITGMADANHWTAWQIGEDAVKVHAEPLLTTITGALTTGYLHPVLKVQGDLTDEEIADLVVWADASELATRPDRGQSAIELYDRFELSGEALRRETGLAETDAPTNDEFIEIAQKQLLIKSPQLAPTIATDLGIIEEPPQPAAPPQAPGNAQKPSQPENPNATPNTDGTGNEPANPAADATLLMFEQVVHRALEKAGNRLRSSTRTNPVMSDCPPEQAHCCIGGLSNDEAVKLLQGAWDRVPTLAEELNLDPKVTCRALQDYCTTLIENGFAYDRDSLRLALVPVVQYQILESIRS